MDSYLQHHGILGMKWGIRRYQNPDGTLTEAGRKRYGTAGLNSSEIKQIKKDIDSFQLARSKSGINNCQDAREKEKKIEAFISRLTKTSDDLKKITDEASENEKKIEKFKDDFYNNEKLLKHILNKYLKENNYDSVKPNTFQYAEAIKAFKLTDELFYYYVHSNVNKKYEELASKEEEYEKRYLEIAKDVTKEALGIYGKTRVTQGYGYYNSKSYKSKTTLERYVDDRLRGFYWRSVYNTL